MNIPYLIFTGIAIVVTCGILIPYAAHKIFTRK